MKIIFHGAAGEVGRSCVELQGQDTKILLDSGLKITEHGNEYPIEFEVKDIDSVYISHAHLDHTGALPLFVSKDMTCPIFLTSETKDLTRLLLNDSLHIEMLNNEFPHYDKSHIAKTLGQIRTVKYKEEGEYMGVRYTYFDAGHIPGSASIVLNMDRINVLYTGDIKLSESELLLGADTNWPNIDILISESTYADREHEDREKEEKRFLFAIRDTIKKGGSVLIPAFGVGRAQEIILMLGQLKMDIPIYLDGMARKVTDLFLDKPYFLKDAKLLKKNLQRVQYVKGQRDRILKQQAIIVSTSGMMTGGPVMAYMPHLYKDKRNSILLTGYQGKGTNGRLLLEKRMFKLDKETVNVKCNVKKFDFSAHSGHAQLIEILKKVNPKMVFFIHGDEPESMLEIARKMGIDAHAPKLGDSFEIEK